MPKLAALLLMAGLALSACGTKRKPAPPPPVAAPVEPKEREPRVALSPAKKAIINVANREWDYFGQQRVIYQSNEESIPHVGYWEDDDTHVYRVNTYWRAVDMPGLDGNDCRQPWSAAFVSWVMLTAGVPSFLFPPSRAHWVYLEHIIRGSDGPSRSFVPHDIKTYKPQPADLICASREYLPPPTIRKPSDASFLDNTKLHCDIVVARNDDTLEAIGGNVRNSVSKSILTLDSSGHLQPTKRRPWFIVIENRM